MADYSQIAKEARKKVLDMIFQAQTSHIGSNFSIIDILTVLFEKKTKDDLIILSAGWKAAAFYYFLAEKGYFPKEDLDTYCKSGSRYIGLTEPSVPGVLFAGGSMGMGLPAAVGFALAKKIKGEKGTVYVIMSDGELQCGTFYESLLIATHHRLDNLTIILDNNGFQAMGRTHEILNCTIKPPMELRMYAMDIDYHFWNGHDYESIVAGLRKCVHNEQLGKNPQVKFLDFGTAKGKGWKRAEGNNLYHYKAPSKEEYEEALKELNV